jgi:hypothetical protein
VLTEVFEKYYSAKSGSWDVDVDVDVPGLDLGHQQEVVEL